MERTCKFCGEDISHRHLKAKFCNGKCKNDYSNTIQKEKRKLNKKVRVCLECGKDISNTYRNRKFCNTKCSKEYFRKQNIIESQKLGDSYPTCKICGFKAKQLINHITTVHKMKISKYKEKYNDSNLVCEETRKKLSENVKGEKNPGYKHNGKLSPWSKKNTNITEEQRLISIEKAKNRTSNTYIEYYLEQSNCNWDLAEWLRNKRQAVNTLKRFIKRYGKEEGTKRFKERQEQWQNTMKSKSPEEIERINRAKIFNRGFSYISQKLFWKLYKKLDPSFNIYFAQLKNGIKDLSGFNHEYFMMLKDRNVFLDFYVKNKKKIIEFDGDYWHGSKGNVKRDKERDGAILKDHPNHEILHVREVDWKKDQEKVIKECIEFING